MERLAPIAFVLPSTILLEHLWVAHFSCFRYHELLKIVHFGGHFEGIRSCWDTKNHYLTGEILELTMVDCYMEPCFGTIELHSLFPCSHSETETLLKHLLLLLYKTEYYNYSQWHISFSESLFY